MEALRIRERAPVVVPVPKPSKRPAVSWALYDLANTIFTIVVTFYLARWITHDLGGRDAHLGVASSVSMALVLVSAPLLGAMSDHARRRMPFLVVTTVICVAFTAMLGVRSLPLVLVAFIAANYFFQAGTIFYDALLPTVSTEENRGRVGGLGVGLGYLGSFIGLAVGMVVVSKPTVFQLTAVLFLLFAIPCFVFVREPARVAERFGVRQVRAAMRDVRSSIAIARRAPGLARFLVGRIFYTDAVNTLTLFITIYLTKEIGVSEGTARLMLMAGIATAIVGGLGGGVIVDRIGPKRALNRVLGLWVCTMALGILIPAVGLPSMLMWVVALLFGLALGGTWAADRPYMLRLTPPRHLGQCYGLYAMVGRFSAILGPLAWAGIVDGLNLGRQAAIGTLMASIGVAWLILRRVSDEPRRWAAEDLAAS